MEIRKVPILRFSEFEEEWEECNIGKLGEIITGNTPPTNNKDFYDGPYLFVSPGDISNQRYISQTKTTVTEAGFKIGRRIKSGSTLFVCIGSTIGKVGQAKIDCICNQQINSINAVMNNPDFVYSLMERHGSKIKLLAGDAAVPIINKSVFSSYNLLIPGLPEQTKIASFLQAVDGRLEILGQKKTLLDRYKQGAMQKIFSQEIRFKDENGNEFGEWEEKKLGEIAEIIGGGTPSTTNKEYWEGEINWFTPTEIKSKYLKRSLRKISEVGLKNSSAKLLPIGSLLFSSRATVGEVGIATEPSSTNQGFQSFVCKEGAFNEFLYYWITFHKNLFLERAKGSTFLEISKSEIQKIGLFLPSFPEQTKIAAFLTALDERIEKVGQQMEGVTDWKKGLLQQMFV